MKNKMMEQDVENMGIMAGFKDMMEMEDDDTEDTNEEDRVASEVMGRSPKSPEILMNNLRGDMRSVEARIDELADMVGYRAAKDTPQEVLALLQPVLAQQQGIGAAPASAELMQGPQPPMAPPGMPPMMPPGAPPEAAPGGMPPEMMAALMGGAGGPQGMAGPPPPETGGIAGAPPMAMARGGYVQNFQAGSTEDGVTPADETVPEKEAPLLKYPTDMVAAAKQGMQELISRQPATIPDLGALARQREPAYRTILGDTRGASEAQMLFSLGQRAFNFGANTDDQGRPLRGSFISRLSGAVRTLPQDMMARVAEIDKGERAIKMAALQASEKDIDQLQSANNELTKQKRALFGSIVASEARIEAEKQKNLNKPPKGPFGTGVTGETLNIFTKLAPDYAAGKLDPEQDRIFLAAVTNYTQPQERVEERTDPLTGNKSYVTIQTRPELPSFVRSALQLRGTALPSVSSAPAPGGGKPGAKAPAAPPGAAGDISGGPGTIPADVPAEARDAYVALKTPKDQKTLWNQRGLVAGPVQYIKTLPVLRVFGQVDAKSDEARTFFDSARRSLIKALAANPRYPVSEMQAIEKEIDIAPAFFDNPNSLGNRLIGIEDFLNQRLKAAEKDAVNPNFPVASRQAALDEIKELKNFNKVAGIPPRVYTIEEVQALPSGTNFLWNGKESKWKK
jgi:hypothetical protein